MKICWPPRPLGLGTPLNLAAASPKTRDLFKYFWWLVPLFGLVISLLMLAIDYLFFGGVSLQRIRELGAQPLEFRVLVALYSGVTEELIYRAFLATFVAWLAHLAASPFIRRPQVPAQWLGVLVSAFFFGLAHVGNLPNVAHPVLRAVAIDGTAGLMLGWLYWWRGLEVAIGTHLVAIVVLYIAVPPFL